MENREMIAWLILGVSSLLLFNKIRKLPKPLARIVLIIMGALVLIMVAMSVLVPEVLTEGVTWIHTNLQLK